MPGLQIGIYACLFYLALLLIKFLMMRKYVNSLRPTDPKIDLPSLENMRLEVIQPILSGDPRLSDLLRDNLASVPNSVHFRWLVDSTDEVGLATVYDLEADMLEKARLTIQHCPPSPPHLNPKSFKLELGIRESNADFIAILDDDTVANQQCFVEAIESLSNGSDLFTALPSYRRGTNFWSDLLAHFVNNNSVLTYLPPLTLFPPISINGMFYVLRRATLLELGGFKAIEQQLCDDYAIKQLFAENDKKIHQGIARLELSTHVRVPSGYFAIMHRWMVFANQLFRDQVLDVQAWLLFFLALPPILLWLGFLSSFWSVWNAVAFGLTILARHLAISLAQECTFRRSLSGNLVISLLAELLQPVHLLGALFFPYINWRGHSIRIQPGNRFETRLSTTAHERPGGEP